MKILAVIPTLNEDPMLTIQSLLAQSVEVSKVWTAIGSNSLFKRLMARNIARTECIYIKPDLSQPLGKRVGTAINAELAKESLGECDYILKLGADVLLPERFI